MGTCCGLLIPYPYTSIPCHTGAHTILYFKLYYEYYRGHLQSEVRLPPPLLWSCLGSSCLNKGPTALVVYMYMCVCFYMYFLVLASRYRYRYTCIYIYMHKKIYVYVAVIREGRGWILCKAFSRGHSIASTQNPMLHVCPSYEPAVLTIGVVSWRLQGSLKRPRGSFTGLPIQRAPQAHSPEPMEV